MALTIPSNTTSRGSSHLTDTQILQLHPGGLGGVKRQNVDESLEFKIVRQRGIDGNTQFIPCPETLACAFGVDTGNKGGLLLLAFAVNPPNETEAVFLLGFCTLVLALGRRYAAPIRIAVCPSEQA